MERLEKPSTRQAGRGEQGTAGAIAQDSLRLDNKRRVMGRLECANGVYGCSSLGQARGVG